ALAPPGRPRAAPVEPDRALVGAGPPVRDRPDRGLRRAALRAVRLRPHAAPVDRRRRAGALRRAARPPPAPPQPVLRGARADASGLGLLPAPDVAHRRPRATDPGGVLRRRRRAVR